MSYIINYKGVFWAKKNIIILKHRLVHIYKFSLEFCGANLFSKIIIFFIFQILNSKTLTCTH